MRLAECTWTDIRDLAPELALLPVGSTEQHGPHAPLGTDALTASAIANAAADRAADPVVVAPTVPIGIAAEHRHFAGTLWVDEDTLRAYVGDALRSLCAHSVDRVVVVNGHGGNVAALRETCARFTREGAGYAVPFTWFDAIETEQPLGHGGPIETSLVWHLAPELIHEDRFTAAEAGEEGEFGVWVAGTNLAYDFREFTESGNLGDPSAADPDRGATILEAATEALVAVMDAVEIHDPSGQDS